MKRLITCGILLLFSYTVSAQSDYNEQLEKAAIAISDKIIQSGKKSTAVLEFENSNKQMSELGRWLSSVFTTHLENNSSGSFAVKNSIDVSKAVQQIKSEMGSGIFESRSIQRLGELSGSDVIIYGIITLMDDDLSINIKAVNPSGGIATPIGGKIVTFKATEGMRAKYDNYFEDETGDEESKPVNTGKASGEGTARTSKNPNCKQTNTGDFCFVNNTRLKLYISMEVKNARYWANKLTIDPGQTQCYYDIPAGPADYNISEIEIGYSYSYSAPGSPPNYNQKGQIYIDACKSKTFNIR